METDKYKIERLIKELGSEDKYTMADAGAEILRMAKTNISPFGEIFEREDVDIEVKRRLMRVLQLIPGAIRSLAIYKIPPLGE
jgi:hypothetical protein